MMAATPAHELVAAALVLVGAAFALIGSVGLVRLPDFFMRLHGPTKATTLGVGAIVAATLVQSLGAGAASLRGLVVLLCLFITAPVVAHVIGRLARRRDR